MSLRLFSIAGLVVLAACATPAGQPAQHAEISASQSSTFSPEAARAFMDDSLLKGEGEIDPVFSADGTRVAFKRSGGIRVVSAADGGVVAEWAREELARQVGAGPNDFSTELEADPFQVIITVDDSAFAIPLADGAEPSAIVRPEAPRTVRSMFPMNGYDRRENRSPDGRIFASLEGPNLALRLAGEDEARVLTSEHQSGRSWFHGNDIWESSGTIWSSDSKHFVARLHDASKTPAIDILDYLGEGETHSVFAYWARAGEPLPRTELHIVDAETGTLTPLSPRGTHDDHLFFIEWSPDNTSILAIRYARDLSNQTIFTVDAATGASRVLVERSVTEGWVKWPSGPQTIRHIPGGGYLLRSDEDGYFQYYRLNATGDVKAQLTSRQVDVGEVIGFSEDADWLYFLSPVSPDRPYDQIPHRVRLDGTGLEQLSEMRGVHAATLSPNGSYIVTVHADHDRASRADLLTSDGAFIATLAQTPTPETMNGLPLPEPFTVMAADGETVMHGTLMKPADFDPTQTYPVIHRVYGAMQSRVQRSGFWPEGLGYPGGEYNLSLNYLANAGFVVVLIDAPGSPGRGRGYNLAQWVTWPGTMPDDYAAGLMALAETRPWMDIDRIGIDGNSWGGYVALYTALERPDVYKTVSISVPETDLLDHVHWIEWQIGTPENNPDVYADGNLADRVGELESEIMIVSGTSDVNVPISNTMKLLDALAEAGKPYDLVLFPGTNHPHQGRGERYAYAVESLRVFHEKHLMRRGLATE